ncbi:LamG-like jellyroll fold domain-containing protein [Solicola sp. PLA-1-18]
MRTSPPTRRRVAAVGAAVVGVLAAGLAATGAAQAQAPAAIQPKEPELTTPWTDDVSADNALPEYPRPQLQRGAWKNLNGEWQFAAAAPGEKAPIGKDLAERVLVPYPIESALSGIKRHEDRMFYRRTFTVPAGWKVDRAAGKRLLLHFGAVDYDATVWVNGTQVAKHRGGYDAFSADVTKALKAKGQQEVVVGVTDFTDQRNQPVGKQRNEAIANPGGIFYTPASGIWQTVWMEPVARAHVEQVVATTQPNLKDVQVDVTATGNQKNTVRLDAYDGRKLVASTVGAAGRTSTLRVAKPKLWTPDTPHLYDLKVTLLGPNGQALDRSTSYFGMRTIGTTAGKDGKLRATLNGKPIFLNSTLDQGYWPDGIYTAPTDEALKWDLDEHKKLGFNTVRKHIKVEPARWYRHADELGLMVWQDMPALNDGEPNKAARDQFESELHTMIGQLRGTTSIIGWVPFNEGWGEWDRTETGRVAESVKADDPTRLVDAHSGVNCCNSKGDSGKGDVIDWHQYTGPAAPSPSATRIAIDGEHGGFGLETEGHMWPGQPNAYEMATSREDLTDRYVANQTKLLDLSRKCGLSGGIYTQITDVEDEVNGFFTYDRQVQKMLTGPVRSINRKLSASGNLGQAPSEQPPGTPGLSGIGRWPADDGSGTTVKDVSGKSHDLTTSGGTSWTDGAAGKALAFDGTGSAKSAGPVVDTTGSYSVSSWVKLDATGGGFSTAVSQDGDRTSAFFLQYDGAQNKFAFSTLGGRAYANETAEAGRWYHLVGVRDAAAQTYTLYLDGQQQGSFTQCLGDASTGPLALGRAKYDGQPVDRLRGGVDETRVFDRALSAEEVASLHDAPTS